ncbi:MAG: aminotransferase class I/II-fold pyridoxal phosphate-dependent enzyme [Bradymonadales bacterium]|nr:aminotransferase class I/II-fold pyridoxal phosphate-dependent enzyme [Bradymonadales bacterium]
MPRIYLSPPHVGETEKALLVDAFDSNWIAPLGPQVEAFEREMAAVVGMKHALALSSGTAALHLALLVLGVGAGDEVVTSTLTFAATAFAITYVGAIPVFIDADPVTWTLDPELLERELQRCASVNRLPRAVIAVDLYGQCADYEAIRSICGRYETPIIEDAAEALGATHRGKAAGSWGDLGVLSFNGNKIITTSGGGMLLSDNPEWIAKARHLATQARDPAPHYQHSAIGYNYRLSNLLAALGRGQLAHLDQRVQTRRAINAFYRSHLGQQPGIAFMEENPKGLCTFWLSTMTVDQERFGVSREEIRLHLEQLDIESRPVWKPMHLQPVFRHCRTCKGEVSERLFDHGLCLPSGSSLDEDAQNRVVEAVLSVPGRTGGH